MSNTLDDSRVPRIRASLSPVAVALAFLAVPAFADQANETKSVCLQADEVDHTHVLNDHQILFYMRGKKVWLNTLRARCITLPVQEGFVWSSAFPEYCANAESIRVVRSGEVCLLGEFTPYEKPVNGS